MKLMRGLLARLIFAKIVVNAIKVLEIITDGGTVHQMLPNVSLGLNVIDQHQCNVKRYKGEKVTDSNANVEQYAMTFTPNRRSQHSTLELAAQQQLRSAVVLAIGGHENFVAKNGGIVRLLASWDSWVEYFFADTSRTTSLVLLFDERDYVTYNQRYPASREQYLDHLLVDNMQAKPVDCISLHVIEAFSTIQDYKYNHQYHRSRESSSSSCSPSSLPNQLALDQNYSVYSISFTKNPKHPLIIFAAVYRFPKPAWAADQDEEELFHGWRTPYGLNYQYSYVKFTNWYSYLMFQLQLLDFFDYLIKLDNDIDFLLPFPIPNLPQRMVEKGHYVFGPLPLGEDNPAICLGASECTEAYLRQENLYCQQLLPSYPAQLVEGGRKNLTIYQQYQAIFQSSFLVVWLGFYTAPEVNHFGRFWNDFHPGGMWTHRWGDQQYWFRPLSLFGSETLSHELGYETLLVNEHCVANITMCHKAYPKWTLLKVTDFYDPAKGSTKERRRAEYLRSLERNHKYDPMAMRHRSSITISDSS